MTSYQEIKSDYQEQNSINLLDISKLESDKYYFADVVKVNGVEIANDSIAREMQYHRANSFEHAKQKATQALVIKQVLLQNAKAFLDKNANEEDAINALIEANIPEIDISQAEIQRFYTENKSQFKTPPYIVARHILFAADKNDLEHRAEQKIKADKILNKIANSNDRKAEFIAYVDLSSCKSKKDAGLLGEITPKQTVPEFERQVFMLEEGLANYLIESRYGYHIVYIDKKIVGKELDLDLCIQRIQKYLQDRRRRQEIGKFLHGLVEKANITGINMQIDNANIFMG